MTEKETLEVLMSRITNLHNAIQTLNKHGVVVDNKIMVDMVTSLSAAVVTLLKKEIERLYEKSTTEQPSG